MLGDAPRVGALEALLERRALAWARDVSGDNGVLVEAATDLAAAVAPDGDLSAAVAPERPTLVVWPIPKAFICAAASYPSVPDRDTIPTLPRR